MDTNYPRTFEALCAYTKYVCGKQTRTSWLTQAKTIQSDLQKKTQGKIQGAQVENDLTLEYYEIKDAINHLGLIHKDAILVLEETLALEYSYRKTIGI